MSAAGIDNYLLYTRPDKLHSRTGLVLRRLLEDQVAFRARVAAKYGAGGGEGAPDATLQQLDGVAAALAELEAAQEPLLSEGDVQQQQRGEQRGPGGSAAAAKAQELR